LALVCSQAFAAPHDRRAAFSSFLVATGVSQRQKKAQGIAALG